ncbi:uncharacterized protein LOC104908351 [Beta vulgaris subsp. vulgaris]|uniref:uncharacterized protein LOC104908351 n=1 Tax=Beta vulgaris subsp. vulgaris TaxID=3555 RepID=UPI00053FDF3B|nr:uncharacterized protein LOC104908351 [Beta vulgaris subsp. vulgaris]
MEYLSRCLDSLNHNPDFNFHPRCERLHITHLMFTDDLLMFARADHSSLELLFDAFSKFSHASGLVANPEKSNLYTAGVTEEEKSDLQLIVKMPIGSFPLKYLGVPLTTRKLFYQECKPLIEKTVA